MFKPLKTESLQQDLVPRDIPISFTGETMLSGWAESNRAGRTVTFRLPEDDPEHPFRRFQVATGKTEGQRFLMVLVMLNDDETPNEQVAQTPYGKNVRELHRLNWFFDRRVLRATGTPDEFREWASRQPCVVCNNPAPSNVLKGLANNLGYVGLSVCNLHYHSEPAALATHQPKLLKKWVTSKITRILGTDGLSDIPPESFKKYCADLGIEETIPDSYFNLEV